MRVHRADLEIAVDAPSRPSSWRTPRGQRGTLLCAVGFVVLLLTGLSGRGVAQAEAGDPDQDLEPAASHNERVQNESTPPGSEKARLEEFLRRAADVYSRFVSSRQKDLPAALVGRAQCVVVFPELHQVGAVVRFTAGNGVMSCRTGATWSLPSWVSVSRIDLGLQFGVQSASAIIYLAGAGTKETFIARASDVLGQTLPLFQGPAGQTEGQEQPDGAYVYLENKNTFLGTLSLDGAHLSPNDAANDYFYGGMIGRAAPLTQPSQGETSEGVKQFASALGETARAS